MSIENPTPPVSRKALWAGYILSALPVLALVMSAIMKFAKPPSVLEGFAKMGYPPSAPTQLGVVELICTVIYLIPSTAVLGAILLTGYMGGAVASAYRIGEPWIMQVLLGVLIWGGLYLRDLRVRALIPVRSCE
jgi:hypothetical protein